MNANSPFLMNDQQRAHYNLGVALKDLGQLDEAIAEHRRALVEHGPCALHRRSFAPVLACDPNAVLDETLDSGDLFFDDSEVVEPSPII